MTTRRTGDSECVLLISLKWRRKAFACGFLPESNLLWGSNVFAGSVDASGLLEYYQPREPCVDEKNYTDRLFKWEAG
jgi:hypothetical protein